MKCSQCGSKFTMLEIPTEERIYEKFSTQFQCPRCRCWLQANKQFKFLSTFGLVLMALSSIATVLNLLGFINIDATILFVFAGSGAVFFIWSLLNLQLEVVQ